MEIESSVSGNSSINVELNVGGRNGTNIDLSDGERLEVSVGGETITLNRDTDFGDIDYEGTVNTSSSADPFRISLFRADGSVINNSIVSLPDEFIITSPNSGQTFSVNETLPIRWTPARSGVNIELIITTSCVTTSGGTPLSADFFMISDDGAEDFRLNQIGAGNGSIANLDTSRDCELSIDLERIENGQLDPRFEEGGEITARQLREVENLTLRLR